MRKNYFFLFRCYAMEKMTLKLQEVNTMKRIWEPLFNISYEFLGNKGFAMCCYESRNTASVVIFYQLTPICILQLSWTGASCKHWRSDFNNFIHMNFSKSSKTSIQVWPSQPENFRRHSITFIHKKQHSAALDPTNSMLCVCLIKRTMQ